MEPLVLREIAALDLVVVDARVVDPGILESERYRVVPGQRLRRRIHGDLRRLLERYRFHVAVGDLTADRAELRVIDRLDSDEIGRASCRESGEDAELDGA